MQGDAFDVSKHRLQVLHWQFALKWLRKGKTFFYIYNLKYNSVLSQYVFWDKVSLCLPRWSWTCYVAGLKRMVILMFYLLDPRIIGMSHHTHLVPTFLFSNFFNVTSPQNIFFGNEKEWSTDIHDNIHRPWKFQYVKLMSCKGIYQPMYISFLRQIH